MQCKKCKKNCMESELVNGYCLDCLQKYKNNKEELKNTENKFGKTLRIASIVIVLLFVFYGLILIIADKNTILAISLIISSVFLGFFIRALSEIIQLLEDIKNK